MRTTTSISTRGLTKVYQGMFGGGKVRALDKLDLAINEGEIFGLLGPNGAGKTTLVKILLSVVKPTEGEALLYGRSINDPDSRFSIGFLPENHRFPEFLTPDQVLHLYGRLAGVPKETRDQRIPELLELVSMSEWRHVRIRKFSKGMMQRVGLAQALINDPQLIFLDEPTDGVDPIGRREIRDVLLVLKEQGKTIFINSHLLSEIERICTRVAIMNKGTIVSEGSIEDLTREETLFDLTTTAIADDLLASLTGRFKFEALPEEEAGEGLAHYRLIGGNRSDLNMVIDLLRNSQVQIESISPVRKTLEDRFVQVIKDTNSSDS